MASKQSIKGSNYERELAEYMTNSIGLTVSRAPLSGGGAIGIFHGGSDLLGCPGLHVEAKRVERLQIEPSLQQAEASLAKTGSDELPVVVSRRNRQPTGDSYTIMRLDDFLEIYKAALRYQGYLARHPEWAEDKAPHTNDQSIEPKRFLTLNTADQAQLDLE